MLPNPLTDWLRLGMAAAPHGFPLLEAIGPDRDRLARWLCFHFLFHVVVGKEWAW